MITPNEYSEQDVEDALLRAAYAAGRKDEREASCVDELVRLLKFFVWHPGVSQLCTRDSAIMVSARAALTKLEQTK